MHLDHLRCASLDRAISKSKKEAQRYTKAMAEAGRGHQLGPPHAHIVRTLLATAISMHEEEEGDMIEVPQWKVRLGAALRHLDNKASPEDVALEIPYFRVLIAYAPKETPDNKRIAIVTFCFAARGAPAEQGLI